MHTAKVLPPAGVCCELFAVSDTWQRLCHVLWWPTKKKQRWRPLDGDGAFAVCPDGVAHDKASFFVMCCWQGTRHGKEPFFYHVLWLKHMTKRDSLFAVCHGHSTRQIDHFSYFIFIRSRIWYPNHHMQFINITINITSISYIIISITGSLYSQSNLQMQINSFIHNH